MATFLSEDGGYGLSSELFTITDNNIDLASFAEGSTQDRRRNRIYTLRIGQKDENYRDKFTSQVGAKVHSHCRQTFVPFNNLHLLQTVDSARPKRHIVEMGYVIHYDG